MRILLVDGHEAYRRQIALLIEYRPDFEIAAEADNVTEAIEKAQKLRPDLIILELDFPLREGFENVRMMRQSAGRIPIIVLSIQRSKELIDEIQAMGMQGYVEKIEAADMLLPAIEAVLNGRTFFPPTD